MFQYLSIKKLTNIFLFIKEEMKVTMFLNYPYNQTFKKYFRPLYKEFRGI